jgi:hypothetical protein
VFVHSYYVTDGQQPSFFKEGERKRNMSATLPLPLELTRPIELTSLEDSLKEAFAIETRKYNADTQVSEDAEGVPMILNGGGGTSSSQESESTSGLLVIDVTVDLQIDDNDF